MLALAPDVEALTGYTREDLLDGRARFADLVHPSDRERVWQEVQEGLVRDGTFRTTYRIRTRSGEERWVLEEGRRAAEVEEEGGDVLAGHIRDVTGPLGTYLQPLGAELDRAKRQARYLELLQAVTAIANEERSLEAALRSALPEICVSLDFAVGHVFWIGGEGGTTPLSSDLWWPLSRRDLDSFRAATESSHWDAAEGLPGRVLASGEPEWVEDVVGDPRFLRLSRSPPGPIRSGVAVPVVAGATRPVVLELFTTEPRRRDPETEGLLRQIGVQLGRVWERERAMEERRSAEHRLQQLTDNLQVLFWMATPTGEILYVSSGVREIVGTDTEPENTAEFLALVHPEDRPRMAELMGDSGGVPYEAEYRIVRPDGEVRWIRQKAFAIEDGQGRVHRVGGLAEDVTERQRAREALEEAGRLLEKTVSSIEEAVLVVAPRGAASRCIVEANPAVEKVFGWTREELLGGGTARFHVDAASWERFGKESESVLSRGEVFRAAFPMRRKDGTVFPSEQTVTLLDPEEGVEGGVVSVVRDVSGRAEAEERFRQIAERIEDVFWISTPGKERIEYVSPAYRDIWGRSPDALYEDPGRWIQAIHPEDRQRVVDALPTQSQGTYEEEYRIVRPDGGLRWIWDRAFPVRGPDGVVRRIVGVAEDITDRVRAEGELRARERRYRAFVENASDVITTLDRDGRLMYQSPALRRLLGYDPEALRGRSVFTLVHPEERSGARSSWEGFVRKEGASLHLDPFRFLHADGSWRIWEATLTNLLHDPSVEAVLANARDVTERVEMEGKMQQSQRLEAIGRLAGGISHDFNNLLTVIRSQTDLLLLDLDGRDPAAADLQVIQAAAGRAATLTSQLLAFSREQVLRPRVVILCEVVRKAAGLLERLLGEDVRIQMDCPGDRPAVEVDPGQLEQVVLNLAVNARDAMPAGGVLRLRTFREDVDEETARERGDVEAGVYTVLEVSDTGEGMDEETRSRIFEPFFTTKGDQGGTGLGLAMAYGFVAQSGGTIQVESVPGQGTAFFLRFPAVDRPPDPEDPATVTHVPSARRSGTVLVVEDDASVRRVIGKILQRAGLDVVEAGDAETGLGILEGERSVDLVLTDLGLPGMSGRALAERVREMRPGIPVVVMSGYAADSPGHGGGLPADLPFLQKPFTPGTLVDTLERAMENG